MKNILVAIDFEKDVEVLLAKALGMGKAFNAKLWLLHVVAPEPYFVGYEAGPQYIRDSRANELREEHRQLQKISKEMNDKGVASDGLLIQGATTEMILEEADKLNIDLIMLGNHAHGFLYNILIGSVASEVINKAKMPVMLIPIL